MAEKTEKSMCVGEEEKEKEGENRKQKIIIAVDESEESFLALKWALENLIAYQIDLYKVYILHAHAALNLYLPPGFYVPPEVMDNLKKSLKNASIDILQRARNLCDEKHVHVETVSLEGDPRDIICQAVEKLGAEMLVMGSHGYGAIKRAFLGSVSDHCLHYARCHVLIVKKPIK